MSDTPAPAPVPVPTAPANKLLAALDGDTMNLLGKYGVAAMMVWQFLAGGIKDTIRESVRAELAPLREQITKLETRLTAIELNRP